MFVGNHDFGKVAQNNSIRNPDLIYPGNKIGLNPLRPVNTLSTYLDDVYSEDFESAYNLLSSQTKKWYSYSDFNIPIETRPEYDLETIEICSEFVYEGKQYLQLKIHLFDDPATWGFTLVREKYKWYLVYFDKHPLQPYINGKFQWRCK